MTGSRMLMFGLPYRFLPAALFPGGILPVFHLVKQAQIFLRRPHAKGRRRSGFRQGAPRLPDLFLRLVVDICQPLRISFHGIIIHAAEIIRRIAKTVPPVTEPFDVALDRFGVFRIFLARIRIVEAQIRFAP
jgi:hypothetical protein